MLERSRQENGGRRPPVAEPASASLGDVARDLMDHASMIARDEARMARLSVSRYVEHLRTDVAPRAMWGAATGVCAALALVCALLALFLGIVWAIGSVAWTFLIFAGLFIIGAGAAASLYGRPARLTTAEDIERRFPSVRAHEAAPERVLSQQATPEAHAQVKAEALREAEEARLAERAAHTVAKVEAQREVQRPQPRG